MRNFSIKLFRRFPFSIDILISIISFFSNYGTANEAFATGTEHNNINDSSANVSSGANFDHILTEQDRGLDSLHNVIVRSRIAAQNIESEVGVQNEIIDGLGNFKSFLFQLTSINPEAL